MTREHDLIEELIAVRALGGLEPADAERLRAEMASHGPDCEQCRALEADYADVAGGLAFALEPVAVRPGFAQETFDRALGGGGRAPADLGAERERRRGVLRPLLGIAAAFVLFVGGWVVGVSVTEDEPALTEATTVSFEGEGGGAITAAYRPGEPGMFLLGDDLPALPENQVYELWVFEGETPVSALCARPSADGSLFEFVDTSLEGVGLMAVTVEPASCPDAPTSDPIFTAEVATA